jgi:uncharacterized membrane protein YbhN (UPF0104 family)
MKLDINDRARMIIETGLMYAISGGVIWYESRGINLHKEITDLASANLWLFVPATLASFLIWFLGENLLFARMFTHFHGRTRFMEVLPATAAEFFLQAINSLLANGALLVFLARRKRVPWITATYTMAFFGFLDGILFSLLIALVGIAVPDSPLAGWSPYGACAFVVFLLIAAWWMWREPARGFEKWLRNRPSLHAFRKANLAIYAELLGIRFAIVAPQAFLFWLSLRAFQLRPPLWQVIATFPAMTATSGAPMTPAGLGPVQAVALYGLRPFAPKGELLAALLSIGVIQLLYRLPLGLGSAGLVVSRVLHSGHHLERESGVEESAGALAEKSSSTA